MSRIAIAILAAVALAGPAQSIAADKPAGGGVKTSSFVPRHRTNRHVYGTPIQKPIVGHARITHHKPAPKKPSSI